MPNYAEQLRPNVKVEGVAEGGAFINGKYYRIGRTLDALAVQDIAGQAAAAASTTCAVSRRGRKDRVNARVYYTGRTSSAPAFKTSKTLGFSLSIDSDSATLIAEYARAIA